MIHVSLIVGSRYINSCPYIRALSIDSPEIQSVLYLQSIRIERSLWIRIQISPWRSRSYSRRYLLSMYQSTSPNGSISTLECVNNMPETAQTNNAPFKYLQVFYIQPKWLYFLIRGHLTASLMTRWSELTLHSKVGVLETSPSLNNSPPSKRDHTRQFQSLPWSLLWKR